MFWAYKHHDRKGRIRSWFGHDLTGSETLYIGTPTIGPGGWLQGGRIRPLPPESTPTRTLPSPFIFSLNRYQEDDIIYTQLILWLLQYDTVYFKQSFC